MNSNTSKPKMEKGDNAKQGATQATKRTDNTKPQPPVNESINAIQELVDITETLKISRPTATISPNDAIEWEEVFKPELGADSGSDDWEIIDERDTKPCVVVAKNLHEKRQKNVESLEKLDLELAGWEKRTKDGKKSAKASEEKREDTEKRRKELKGDIKRLDRLLDEVNAEN